jgi:hypothetical protein
MTLLIAALGMTVAALGLLAMPLVRHQFQAQRRSLSSSVVSLLTHDSWHGVMCDTGRTRHFDECYSQIEC